MNVEHEYGSRLLQRVVAPDDTPAFVAVDVFDGDEREPPLPYSFWLEPATSYSGHLGFHVASPASYCAAREELRAAIGRLGATFQRVPDDRHASVHLAGDDDHELLDRRTAVVEELGLGFDERCP